MTVFYPSLLGESTVVLDRHDVARADPGDSERILRVVDQVCFEIGREKKLDVSHFDSAAPQPPPRPRSAKGCAGPLSDSAEPSAHFSPAL